LPSENTVQTASRASGARGQAALYLNGQEYELVGTEFDVVALGD
jgi:hypothetical protein